MVLSRGGPCQLVPEAAIIRARPSTADDAELVERALAGDTWAEEALFRRHAPALHGLVVRLLGRRHEAEDVVQDTFVVALSQLDRLRDPDALAGWLRQIAVRRVQRRYRRRQLLARLGLDRGADDATLEMMAAPGATAEDQAELALLSRVLDDLPSRERIPWMLRHVEGATLPEVARACDCSLATAKRRIAAAQTRIDQHTEETA